MKLLKIQKDLKTKKLYLKKIYYLKKSKVVEFVYGTPQVIYTIASQLQEKGWQMI